jgi:hypothetical protein
MSWASDLLLVSPRAPRSSSPRSAPTCAASLLIGVRDAVNVILDAVDQANRTLGREAALDEIELIELNEDRAIYAAHAVAAALKDERLRGVVARIRPVALQVEPG